MPKNIIIHTLSMFRSIACSNVEILQYPLKLDLTKTLKVYSLNILLQYIFQSLIACSKLTFNSQLMKFSQTVTQFIHTIYSNFPKIAQISQPMLYCYPKVYHDKYNYNKKADIKKQMQYIQKQQIIQLRGGIYFKIILIVCHLIHLNPSYNYSKELKQILFKNCQIQKQRQSKVVKFDKKRTQIDQLMFNLKQQHENYQHLYDQPLHPIPVLQNKKNKLESLNDLTPFYLDYLLMKIVIHLQEHIQTNDQQIIQNNTEYSKIIIEALRTHSRINQDISLSNIKYQKFIQNFDDLIQLKRKSNIMETDSLLSPKATIIPNLFSAKGQQCYDTPTKTISRIRSNDHSSSEKKNQLLKQVVQNNSKAGQIYWKNNFHQYFRDEAKQLLLIEFMHIYYVNNTKIKKIGQIKQNISKKIFDFEQNFQNQIQQNNNILLNKNKINQKKIIRSVNRFYPYTCKQKTVLKIKAKCLKNLTMPITIKIKQPNYELNKRQNTFIYEDYQTLKFSKIDLSFIQNIKTSDQSYLQQENNELGLNTSNSTDNKINQNNYCQLVTRKGTYFCEWTINKQGGKVVSRGEKSMELCKQFIELRYGCPQCNIIINPNRQFKIPFTGIIQIFMRKYNQIINNSIEIMYSNGTTKFISFYTSALCEKFIRSITKFVPKIKIIKNYIKQWQQLKYTDKWVNGEISNFDYLMLINKFTGRSYCDLNQYYIFPWILQDYSSNQLDLLNENVYRNLGEPIGALNKKKLSRYLEKLNSQTQENGIYLYGSHYSTSLFIFYYLVRLQPFSTLHRQMQGGNWDSPDRMFTSLEAMWSCLMNQTNTSDIKEAIPEFYYLPAFLKNLNNVNFGSKQSGMPVNNVELPKWAKDANDFIVKMRAALQSDYVSAKLNEWIDLIFGKDQKSLEKNNLFHPLSYAQNIDIRKIPENIIDATFCQINFFGQNPMILFKSSHRQKKIALPIVIRESILLRSPIKQHIFNINCKLNQEISITNMKKIQNQFCQLEFVAINNKHCKIRVLFNAYDNVEIEEVIKICRQKTPITYISKKYDKEQNQTPFFYIKDSKLLFSQNQTSSNTLITQLPLIFPLSECIYNDMFIVYYGHHGLYVYNWQCQMVWSYVSECVINCYLDNLSLIFGTSHGQLLLYDFVLRQLQIIFTAKCYDFFFEVFPIPKIISHNFSNKWMCKIIYVVNRKKLHILQFEHH